MAVNDTLFLQEDSSGDYQIVKLVGALSKVVSFDFGGSITLVDANAHTHSQYAKPALSFSKVLENPSAAEDSSIGATPVAITVTKMYGVIVGSATPSVTWTIRHSTDRDAVGNEVVTGGTTTTTVNGASVISFNDATIPANSYIWLETTAQSGTVLELMVTIIYTED